MSTKQSVLRPESNNALEIEHHDGKAVLSGVLDLDALVHVPGKLSESKILDLSGIERLDTAGAWYLSQCEKNGARLENMPAAYEDLYQSVKASLPQPDPPAEPLIWWRDGLEKLGKRVVAGLIYLKELTEYLGRFLIGILRSLRHPKEFRLTSLVYHCQETGLKAVPIVALMAFLIGVVLAFQGASQLQRFGAEVFVVDLIAIAVLRELGILLTAIIVAGRTASALTAAIGSMKMREEIDAMRTLGLNPDMVLLVPRVLALIITLPLLGLVADVAGLLGGAIMSWIELGVSPSMFKTRLVDGIDVKHAIVGLVKAPVFALIIGIIGVHAGMQVGSDAESLGRRTSSSVVSAIFAVIIADALFSVFFAQVGL